MSKRIAVLGLPFFAQRTAEGLREAGYDARYVARPGRSPRAWLGMLAELARADLVYAIGSSVATWGPLDLLALARRRIVMHWVGSDVQYALADGRRGRASRRLIRRATHWADAPWLVNELRPLRIRAAVRPLPVPIAVGEAAPLPAEFRVLVYLPERPHAAYAVDETLAVMRALPDVRFVIAGGFAAPAGFANVTSLGFVAGMADVYRDSVVLLRLVHHDGLSHSVVEALSYGRHAVWTYPFEGAIEAATPEAAIAALRDLQRRFTQHELGVNVEGIAKVTQRYSWSTILDEARTGVDRLLS